jgi:inhibitor of KinA
MNGPQIIQLGDNALTITFGNVISRELNDMVLAADAAINATPFAGFIETVPAYSSLSVFYDAMLMRKDCVAGQTSFETVMARLENTLQQLSEIEPPLRNIVEVPISFAPADAPDLELLAEAKGLTREQVIDIFTAQTYRVFMLGFLPGFSYMGEVDERIAMRRKDSPRKTVPKGSVGIAGRQTGIYSMSSPGGWQIIGRTDIEMFLPDQTPPSRLQAGNSVRFIATE